MLHLLAPGKAAPTLMLRKNEAGLCCFSHGVRHLPCRGRGSGSAGAPAPALVLERTLPLSGVKLEDLQKADNARLKKHVVEYSLGGMPGLYYTRVKLGTPSKEYILQFDTGSDIPWVSCTPCKGCPTSSEDNIKLKSYNPNSSSTSSRISCSDDRCTDAIETGYAVCNTSEPPSSQCGYIQTYADGSATLGCSKLRSDNMQTDGIIGFGQNAVPAISQLNSQGLSPKVFSHCLKGSEDGGGILVLGEVVKPGIVFTPLIPSQPHYNVNLKRIAVNGKNISINSSFFTTSNAQGTIVDSGTSLTYLADGVYDPVLREIVDAIPLNSSDFGGRQCYFSSLSKVSLFPTVTLNFEGGASMTVEPKNYLLLIDHYENYDVLCIGLQPSKGIKNFQNTTILGDIVLRDKIFVYNLEKMSIGWVNCNCSLLNTSTTLVVSESSGRRAPLFYSSCTAIGVVLINVLRRCKFPHRRLVQ
uniref:Uncharacterized protein n=1 Tax=Avena sativa TaxID=4498 RepID=A0ACD5WDS7_AVESA